MVEKEWDFIRPRQNSIFSPVSGTMCESLRIMIKYSLCDQSRGFFLFFFSLFSYSDSSSASFPPHLLDTKVLCYNPLRKSLDIGRQIKKNKARYMKNLVTRGWIRAVMQNKQTNQSTYKQTKDRDRLNRDKDRDRDRLKNCPALSYLSRLEIEFWP